MKPMQWLLSIAMIGLLAACGSVPVRRVSEPAARIQQLTVQPNGNWSVELRLENFSSVPMRFDAVDIAVAVADQAAGTLRAQPGVTIGPESADVITVALQPSAGAKLAVADALSGGKSLAYALTGKVDATPDERSQRSFEIKRISALSPAPGLPGVLR
jgi:hypothetical protein